ncbi:transposase [Halanaerobium saccharolyticum]|uniref:Transposase n=1 Tax=Halanaerobium saccharolyticum TaxID=43595 RepID=A0A4R6LYF1_9FIRM|nr:transposase [Halanaerobium saccharolyticum]TDO93891.1 transposase [Halanaerobium saccharolyticum]
MSRRSPSRNQISLIPELVKNRIENKPHAARFFFYIASVLYLPFYETEYQGTPPYDRPTLVALILYSLYKGQFTPEEMIEFAKENLGAIWILGKMSLPSAKTLSRVIADILDNIELIFEQVICLCHTFNLIGQERMYIDGTKTKANASKHKAMSYEYMCKK